MVVTTTTCWCSRELHLIWWCWGHTWWDAFCIVTRPLAPDGVPGMELEMEYHDHGGDEVIWLPHLQTKQCGNLSQDLMVVKARFQRLCFMLSLKRAQHPQQVLLSFDRKAIDSVLTYYITRWWNGGILGDCRHPGCRTSTRPTAPVINLCQGFFFCCYY